MRIVTHVYDGESFGLDTFQIVLKLKGFVVFDPVSLYWVLGRKLFEPLFHGERQGVVVVKNSEILDIGSRMALKGDRDITFKWSVLKPWWHIQNDLWWLVPLGSREGILVGGATAVSDAESDSVAA